MLTKLGYKRVEPREVIPGLEKLHVVLRGAMQRRRQIFTFPTAFRQYPKPPQPGRKWPIEPGRRDRHGPRRFSRVEASGIFAGKLDFRPQRIGDRPLADSQAMYGSCSACRDGWPTIRAAWLYSLSDLPIAMAA